VTAGGEYTRPLSALRREDEPSVGGKSASLGELLAADIPVPPGFALSTEAFAAFVAEAGLDGKISAVLDRVSGEDIEALEAASRSISEAMRSAPVPEAIREEVERRYAELESETGAESPPVAVRSSALGEDGQDATFAGQQETYLWVRGPEHVCDAVRDCWVSLYSSPAISYRARLGRDQREAAMGVAVQLMVDASVSGVMFTCNPVSGDPSMVAVNASWGLGLAVVGGEVTPDDYLVSKVTREVVRQHVHRKEIEYVPDPGGRGAVRVAVPDERASERCLDDGTLRALVDVGRRVERHFGSAQDIEWAISKGGDEIFVVQSRPVTAMPKRSEPKKPVSALSLVMGTFGVKTGNDGAD
jgi:pyruvate,water dikinase